MIAPTLTPQVEQGNPTAEPLTKFTADDAAELRGLVNGLYSPKCIHRSHRFWESAVRDALAEEGIDDATAAKVAPAVFQLLIRLRDSRQPLQS